MLTKAFKRELLRLVAGISRVSTSLLNSSEIYVGLLLEDPTPEGNIVEPQPVTGYEKAIVGHTNASIVNALEIPEDPFEEIVNNKTIFFPKALSNYPPVTHVGIFGKTSTGTIRLIAYGELDTPLSPLENEVPIIEPGELRISIE